MSNLYQRLVDYLDQEVALGAQGAYDATLILHRGTDHVDHKVTTLYLDLPVGDPGREVRVSVEDTQVEWFEVVLSGRKQRVSLFKKYDQNVEQDIHNMLLRAGI